MKCPDCSSIDLKASALEENLIVAECNVCEGLLLPMMNYRYWVDNTETELIDCNVDSCVYSNDSSNAKFCPKCNMIMLKYKIDVDAENRLDYCGRCDEIWLDKDEWDLIKKLGLASKVPDILTDNWQKILRKKHQLKHLDKKYLDLLGDKEFEKLREFAAWYLNQKDKYVIQQYLNMIEK